MGQYEPKPDPFEPHDTLLEQQFGPMLAHWRSKLTQMVLRFAYLSSKVGQFKPQAGPFEPQFGPNEPKVGPKLAHFSPKLAHLSPKLAYWRPKLAHLGLK